MKLKFLNEELAALNLNPIPLNALIPNDDRYSVMLNQYQGELRADDQFIGNKDKAGSTKKFIAFGKLLSDQQPDLAACPEYSCPWDSLRGILDSGHSPSVAKLWILGCESIKPNEFKAFVEEYKSIVWIFDTELINKSHQKTFLDPVCLLFKALDAKGNEVLVIAVQFKNQHMSVHSDLYREDDYLIEGQFIYVLSNVGNTVNLMVMICSDSLKFNYQDIQNQNLDKLLIVHLQMNLDPRHHIFKEYRNTIFNAEPDKIETICLNWAKDSSIFSKTISYSGTAYFLKTDKPIIDDVRLDKNQNEGLFYSYWNNKRCHSYFFSSDEYVVMFTTSKASQALVEAPLRRREGPEVVQCFSWVDPTYARITPFPDTFHDHCLSLKCDLTPLDNLGHTNRERLIKLSNGRNLLTNWYKVSSLDFYAIDDGEILYRMAFVDEPNAASVTGRSNHLMNLKELIIIFNDHKKLFPASHVKLINSTKIYYDIRTGTIENVYSKDDQKPIGTIAFIGSSTRDLATREYDALNELHLNGQNAGSRNRDKPMIIVWYNDGGIKSFFHENVMIDANLEESAISIDKELK